MSGPFEAEADERWARILELAETVVDFSKPERLAYLRAKGVSENIIEEVLLVVDEFEAPSLPGGAASPLSSIGHFTLKALLGQGGSGEVYSALDTELNRMVALKVLSRQFFHDADAANRLLREARAASALNHPNIITVYELIRSDAVTAIVMELAPGESLRALAAQPLAFDRVIDIGAQIANALSAAHARNIIHRDIKPENVMVRPDGQIKLLDFGLARSLALADDLGNWTNSPSLPAGTWRYMSPEQCRGEELTAATDIFSFGLVLYELCAGKHAFDGLSAFDTLQAIASRNPPPPSRLNPDLPGNLDSLIVAMLAQNPAARPTADFVLKSLAAPTTKSRSRQATWVSRLRWIAAGVAIAVVAGLIFLWPLLQKKRAPAFYQVTSLLPENRATAAAISPDGKYSAYANADGIFLRLNQTGEITALRSPEAFLVDQLSWFSDGAKLLASGFSGTTNEPSIWSVSAANNPPRRLRADVRGGAPSADGSQISFFNNDRSQLWIAGSNGEAPRRILNTADGDSFTFAIWSADGERLSFQRRHFSTHDLGFVMRDRFFERTWESVNVQTGRIVSSVPDFWVDSAAALADGRLALLRFDHLGADYSNELWETQTDPNTGAFRGTLEKVAAPISSPGIHIHGLSTTSDGKQAMVITETDEDTVFVADLDKAAPRFLNVKRLTLDTRLNFPHAWTPDSRSVIFESNRLGTWDIFKQRVDRRTAEPVIASPFQDEVLPQLSPDGTSILYASKPASPQTGQQVLMRVSLDNGTPEQVPTGGTLDEFRCAAGRQNSCVLRKTFGREYFAFYELDPVKGIGSELARTAWLIPVVGDWDLSPDGSTIAIPNHDTSSAKIRLLQLHAKPGAPQQREMLLPGLTDLSGLVSAADNSGWFVSLNATIGRRMVFVFRDGTIRPLGDIDGWAVPSLDGRRVAFRDRLVGSNAWIIDLR
jgi:eukaryotic-like serine/threonine-protein kinase